MAVPLYTDLSLSAQTNFAELVEQARAAMLSPSIFDVPGSFNKKSVKGGTYWYWQYRDLAGAKHQVYLGPDDERLAALIQQRQQGAKPAAARTLAALAGACTSLGCMTVTHQHFRVINRLAEQGFFRAGGVLVGTHAFLAMSNMLGVKWERGWRTNDIDVAHPGRNVSLALPPNVQVNVDDAITSLEMGLLPARSITSGVGATYFDATRELRVDLLTTIGRGVDDVYHHEQLNAKLQPLKFMEFSLENVAQTAILSGENAVLVNLPSPMRYALHKLLVMSMREEAFQAKIEKDAGQVAALAAFGIERAAARLQQAADDIMGRGRGWRSRIGEGLALLRQYHPEVAGKLAAVLGLNLSRARQ